MMIFNSTIANGLRDFQGQADKAAQRIANSHGPNAEDTELGAGSVRGDEELLEQGPDALRPERDLYGPDGRHADPLNQRAEGGGYASGTNVDLAEELIAMKLAQRGSEALINVYKAGDDMIGGLLDELA